MEPNYGGGIEKIRLQGRGQTREFYLVSGGLLFVLMLPRSTRALTFGDSNHFKKKGRVEQLLRGSFFYEGRERRKDEAKKRSGKDLWPEPDRASLAARGIGFSLYCISRERRNPSF